MMGVLRIRIVALTIAVWLASPGAARAELRDLDLEALMDLRLNTMGLSDIQHTHPAGEWMLEYKFMYMRMKGNRKGTHRVSEPEVLRDYLVAPTGMDMEMHMFHFMYAPTDEWTVMTMVPYVRKSMDHVTRMGGEFTTRSHGMGDVKVGALYRLREDHSYRLVAKAMLGIPTGEIDEKDDTPAGNVRLPYPMQLASGSFDLHLGLTYLGQHEGWGWGAHGGVTQPLDRNSNGYRLGTTVEATAWGAREITDWMSASLRVNGLAWGNIHGADGRLNPMLVPTADPHRRAGRRVDLLAGVNLFALRGPLSGHRLTLEGGVPVYQWLDGPQLELDWRLGVGWNWSF